VASDADLQYYQRRAIEEQKRAETAADICVALVHRSLQRAYERKMAGQNIMSAI
jgi:hypothetical protein